jgi:hypothetical protein
VPGQHLEVVVAMEQGRPMAHGDGGDQAVGQLADGLAAGPAAAVELGGGRCPEVDPGRRVGQDPDPAGTSGARSSSRSPGHPVPSMGSG